MRFYITTIKYRFSHLCNREEPIPYCGAEETLAKFVYCDGTDDVKLWSIDVERVEDVLGIIEESGYDVLLKKHSVDSEGFGYSPDLPTIIIVNDYYNNWE